MDMDMDTEVVFNCTKCNRGFKTLSTLQHHRGHHNESSSPGILEHQCRRCGQCFEEEDQLLRHDLLEHSSLMRRRRLPSPQEVVVRKRRRRRVKIDQAERRRRRAKMLQRNILKNPVHTSSDSEPNQQRPVRTHPRYRRPKSLGSANGCVSIVRQRCSHCRKFFHNRERLEAHVETFHKEASENLCFICNMTFPSLTELEDHVLLHYQLGTRVQCAPYEQTFRTRMRLQSGRGLPAVCPATNCGKMLASDLDIFLHARIHLNSSVSLETFCPWCHERYEYTEKTCGLCPDCHDYGTRPLSYTWRCSQCPAEMDTDDQIWRHLARHAKRDVAYSRTRGFTCSVCTIAFRSGPELLYHLKAHGKRFRLYGLICNKCNTIFSTQAELECHSHQNSK